MAPCVGKEIQENYGAQFVKGTAGGWSNRLKKFIMGTTTADLGIIDSINLKQYMHNTKGLVDELNIRWGDVIKNDIFEDDIIYKQLVSDTNEFRLGAIDVGMPGLKDVFGNDVAKNFTVENYDRNYSTFYKKIGPKATVADGAMQMLNRFRGENDIISVLANLNNGLFNKILKDETKDSFLLRSYGLKADSISKEQREILYRGFQTAGGRDYQNGFITFTKSTLGNTVFYTGTQLAAAPAMYPILVAGQVPTIINRIMDNEYIIDYGRKEIDGFISEFNLIGDINDELLKGQSGISDIYGFKKIKDTTIGSVFPDLYNAADHMVNGNDTRYALGLVLTKGNRYKYYDSIDELTEYFRNLKKDYPKNYDEEIIELRERLYNAHRNRTSYKNSISPKVYSGGKMTVSGKQAGDTFFNFMAGWGMGNLENTIDIISNNKTRDLLSGKMWTEYVENVEQFGSIAAADKLDNIIFKNDSFIKFLSSLKIAGQNAIRQEKIGRANGASEWTTSDYITHGLMRSSIGQAFASIPRMRAIGSSFGYMYAVSKSTDGDISEKAIATGALIFTKFAKEAAKRLTAIKGVAGAVGKTYEEEGFLGVGGTVEAWRDSIVAVMGSYKYFAQDESELRGYKVDTVHTTNLMLKSIGISNMDLDTMMGLKNGQRIKELSSMFDIYGQNFLKYNLPFLSNFETGRFKESDHLYKLADISKNDKVLNGMNLGYGKFDKEDQYTKDRAEYAYNRMTSLVHYDAKGYPKEWWLDFSGIFKDKYGNRKPNKQWEEDLFSSLMMENKSDIDKELFKKEFSEAVDTNHKAAIQILGFMEANTPGSAKKMLGGLMAEEFSAMTKGHYYGKGTDFLNNTAWIRSKIGAKYGDLMYISDKPSRGNMELFYIRQKYTEMTPFLSKDTKEEKGVGAKDVDILFPKTNRRSTSYADITAKNAFMGETYAIAMMNSGEINGPAFTNALGLMRAKRGSDMANPDYTKMKLGTLNVLLDKIDGFPISDNKANIMKMSVFAHLRSELNEIQKDPVLKKELGKTYEDTLYFLYGTKTKALAIKKEKEKIKKDNNFIKKNGKKDGGGLKEKDEEDKSGKKNESSYSNLKGNGTYYKSVGYNYNTVDRMNSSIYSIFKDMSDNFKFTKTYAKPNYTYNTYSSKERDYLTALGDNRSKLYQKFRNFGQKSSGGGKPFVEHATRASNQKGGFAVPPRLREMPRIYKDTDWTVQGTIKETRRRAAVKYDPGRARSSVIKGQISRPAIMPVIKVGGNTGS